MKKIFYLGFILSSFLFSDNEPNNICSQAEIIEQLDGATSSVYRKEEGKVHQQDDKYDYYKFTVEEEGKLKIDFYGNKTSNSLYVGRSCSNISDIASITNNSNNKSVSEFTVNKGETIYVKIERRYDSWMYYDLKINFEYTDPVLRDDKDFKLRYTNNIKGNVRVIGNTILDGEESSLNNSIINLKYTDIDDDSSTFNSSSAKIEDTFAGVDISNAEIIWAGIFWQGVLHNDQADSGIDTHYENKITYGYNTANTAKPQIINILKNDKMKLTLSSGETYSFSQDEILIDFSEASNSSVATARYSAFANLTDFLKGKHPNLNYTVANLMTRKGKTYSGRQYDGTGAFAAWSLVIVYKNKNEADEKTRNISIFDGYKKFNNNFVNIPLVGFKTPKSAPNGVDSTISIFAAEGDRGIEGDYAILINEDNYSYTLPKATGVPGNKNYFSSSIELVEQRNPKRTNNAGIDIHTTKIGTSEGSDRPIKINQTSATLKIGSSGDVFMPSMVAFATELYVPELCYDYDIRLGDNIKLSATDDRRIDINNFGKDLSIKVLIRSKATDFDFENATIKVNFNPEDENKYLTYIPNSSFVSPPEKNVYIPVPDLSPIGTVAIGKLNDDKTKGVIGSLESTYVKQKFSFSNGSYKGTFDFDIEGDVLFDGMDNPIHYELSTAGNSIKRCPINAVYNPIWGRYNIERTDSDPEGTDSQRYPLYTQVAGKDFQVSVRRYTTNAQNVWNKPLNTTSMVEFELINASLFNNNADAGYDSSCEEPDKIGGSTFVYLNNTAAKTVNIPSDIPEFNNDQALKNVAFRVWYLGYYDEITKEFNVVDHQCSTTDGNCFKDLYKNTFKDVAKGECLNECETNYTAGSCYSCLKINFAKPLCSRDNFAIKPAAFHVTINDDKEGDESKKFLVENKNDGETTISAEYNYNIDIRAKQYNLTSDANNYYKYDYKKEVLTKDEYKNKPEYIVLEDNNKDGCFDRNNYTYDYPFINSKIYEKTKFTHTNAGEYKFKLKDTSWTEVDQADYSYKPSFGGVKTNDCILNNPENIGSDKVGCDISSVLDGSFTEIGIKVNPYQFIFDTTTTTEPGNKGKVLMNNFNSNYFNTNPITMGTKIKGVVKASGKLGTTLTNYTNSCVSKDLSIEIERTTAPIEEKDLYSTKYGNTRKDVFFQQYLLMQNNAPDIKIGIDNNVTLLKNEFTDLRKGESDLELYLTFKKPIDGKVLPLRITIDKLTAAAKDAASNTNKEDLFIPTGSKNENKVVDYLFGKVTPFKKLFGPTLENHVDTPIFVDIYCIDMPGLSCAELGLVNHTKGQDEDQLSWYSADIFTKAELGTVDLSIQTTYGTDATPTIKDKVTNKSNGVYFDDGEASQNDTEVRLAGSDRPSTVEVTIKPAPWLVYDENNINGYPTFKVQFIGSTAWTGVGETGNTMGAKANNVPNRRIHW